MPKHPAPNRGRPRLSACSYKMVLPAPLPLMSRKHAEIIWNGQDAILVDLQSTNGTTVNDTPIENWLLADGDVITVGHSHIEVRIVN